MLEALNGLGGFKKACEVRRGKCSGSMGGVGAEGAWYELDQNTLCSCMKPLKNTFLIRDKLKKSQLSDRVNGSLIFLFPIWNC